MEGTAEDAAAESAEPVLTEATFNQLGARMLELIDEAKTQLRDKIDAGMEARDLALSATHLEDALTRWNSSRYRRRGSWGRADPDLGSFGQRVAG